LPTLDGIDLSNFYRFDEETKGYHIFMCISVIACHCKHLAVSLLGDVQCTVTIEEVLQRTYQRGNTCRVGVGASGKLTEEIRWETAGLI